MKYQDINTPSELLKYMEDNIKYGFVNNIGIVYTPYDNEKFQKACQEKWHLSSPENLINIKYGNCFDCVELERDWFIKHHYSCKTFYIWFELPYSNTYTAHTYLVYEDKDKYYYFEYSDSRNRGIYAFASYEEAIKYQKEKHIENNKQRNKVSEKELKNLHVYEYAIPSYGLSKNEFIDYILAKAKKVK